MEQNLTAEELGIIVDELMAIRAKIDPLLTQPQQNQLKDILKRVMRVRANAVLEAV